MSKIYDYDKNTFKRVINKKGNITYFIKVDGRYIEVSKEVFLLLRRSYEKIKYDKKREVAKSVQYYGDIDLAASFIFNRKYYEDFTDKIYLHDLYMKVVDQIYKLPEKYKEIAICIFLKEMTKEEMQRFLIKEAQRGSTEMEAYRNLMEILGIEFPNEKKEPIE